MSKLSLTAAARGAKDGATQAKPISAAAAVKVKPWLNELVGRYELERVSGNDAEQSVLSVIMQAPEYYERCQLGSHEFIHPTWKMIYEAMGEVTQEGGVPNVIGLTNHFRERGKLERIDSVVLMELQLFTPTLVCFDSDCEIIHRHYLDRELMKVCAETIHAVAAHEKPRREIVETLVAAATGMLETRAGRDVTSEGFNDLFAEIQRRMEDGDEPMGLLTGVPSWDHALKGIFPAEMIVLASRPAVGKTSLMETAIETLMFSGRHTLVVQKDMSVSVMFGRMAARRAGVVYDRFITGLMTSGEMAEFRAAASQLKARSHLLHMLDSSRLTATELDAAVRKAKREYDISSWWLDHFFQLQMKSRGGENLTEAATDASTILRRTTHETKVPGIILCHINREGGKADRPRGSNLKYCDALLGDADKVLILWSEQDAGELKRDERQEIIFTVDKNRVGGVGDERMHFHRETMTFEQI